MVVLDTNVISETMRKTPHPAVLAWLDGQTAAALFVTEAEIRFGIARLPEGSRRDGHSCHSSARSRVSQGVTRTASTGRVASMAASARSVSPRPKTPVKRSSAMRESRNRMAPGR